jgi:hypothetical protein
MPDPWAILTWRAETIRWIALGVCACASLTALVLLGIRLFRANLPPEEIEKRRRLIINNKGKIGDGEVLDVDGEVILYTYSVGGVEYTVGQDVSAMQKLLPEDRMRIVGPTSVRFDPANPPNSIVLCEQWSGLRPR